MYEHKVIVACKRGVSGPEVYPLRACCGMTTGIELVNMVVSDLASAFIMGDFTPLNAVLHPDSAGLSEPISPDLPKGACCDGCVEVVDLILAEMKKAQGMIDSIK